MGKEKVEEKEKEKKKYRNEREEDKKIRIIRQILEREHQKIFCKIGTYSTWTTF